MKFAVGLNYDCTEWRQVEADSAEEAEELAYAEAKGSLCHQCSNKLELGDIVSVVILDERGQEVKIDERATLHKTYDPV